MIDSGWNWTPSIGSVRWRTPMISSSGVRAVISSTSGIDASSITSEVEVASRRLILLPLWIASYRQGDLVVRVLVNGQSGAVTGRVPVDRRRVALAIGAALLVAALIALAWWWFGERPG